MERDSKGHFLNPDNGFTICESCLQEDWKNYFVDLTERT